MEENQFSNFETQQKLPNATAVLVLGILSIITCCCYGVLGIITGVVALVLAKKDTTLYNSNPSLYTNFSQIKTGKILAIIGIILSVIYIAYIAWIVSYFGMEALQDQELMQQKIRELMGQ
jgi:hypothetical protein